MDILSYTDSMNILSNTQYSYYVTCNNTMGESKPWIDSKGESTFINIQSWPNKETIESSKILSIYPNPIHKTNVSYILYALGPNFSNTSLELINIRGQIVNRVSLQAYQQGWHRENINNLISYKTAAGIYIVRLRSDTGLVLTQKITILP